MKCKLKGLELLYTNYSGYSIEKDRYSSLEMEYQKRMKTKIVIEFV